ncbi:MAG: MMPL family transporter [Acidobacteria bacterium]|nr:MMPL family transporter [Acidobacteriota bacterium]
MTPQMEKKTLSMKTADLILRFPKSAMLLGLVMAVLAIPGVTRLQSDFTYRIWFRDGDPLLETFDRFERRFGNDEAVAVVIHSPSGIFDTESTTLLQNLTKDMWQVAEIIRVDSLTNYNWTHAEVVDGEDELFVDPLIPDPDDQALTEEVLKERESVAVNHEVIPGYLVSQDGKTAVIFARLKPAIGGSPDFEKVIQGTREKIKAYEGLGDHEFYLTGNAAVTQTFKEVTQQDMQVMVPALLGAIVLFLLFFFRRLSGMLMPLIVIVASISITMGLSGWLGIKINNLTAIVPHILIAIAIADAVHIMVTFFQFRQKGLERLEAIRGTLVKNLQPTLLTSISTAIGFFSFATAKITPIMSMGVLAGVGTLIAWVVTILVLSPMLALIPINIKQKPEEKRTFEPSTWSLSYTRWLQQWRTPVLILFAVFSVISLYVASRNVVNSDPFKYFAPSVPTRVANEFIEENLGGSMGLEIVVNSGEKDGIYEPEFLNKVDVFQDWLNELPYVTKTVSLVDIVKQINRSLHNEAQEAYVIPDDRGLIAQELLLYTMGLPQGMELTDRMTLDYDMIRLTAMWTLHESRTSLVEMKRIEAKAAELGLNAYVTGKTPLWHGLNPYVVGTFIVSISLALVLVSILMVVVFRSVRLGLLSMIPNTVPLIFGGAIMTILNKPLDIGTVIVASVCLGIAVDDTIHFLSNFNRWRQSGADTSYAVAQVITHTGPALLVTTVILVAGFGTFAFASFVPNINFGIMTAIILTTALIADFTLLPAMLLRSQPQESESSVLLDAEGQTA